MKYSRPKSLLDVKTHYCPGCGHGIVHRLICEVIDELGIREKVIGTSPVGCAVMIYDYIDVDMIECAHGRIPAAATAIKRLRPDNVVFAYQGDGDLASIGMAETIHAANRGENFTVIFINNAIYGMTGGQMAPTTLIGQKTTTTPLGRTPKEGMPIRMCEMLATLEAPAYIERVAVNDAINVLKAKKAIKKAFENQINGKGYSFVEVLSQCPVNWKLSSEDAVKFVKDEMMKYFPLGVFKDKDGA